MPARRIHPAHTATNPYVNLVEDVHVRVPSSSFDRCNRHAITRGAKREGVMNTVAPRSSQARRVVLLTPARVLAVQSLEALRAFADDCERRKRRSEVRSHGVEALSQRGNTGDSRGTWRALPHCAAREDGPRDGGVGTEEATQGVPAASRGRRDTSARPT